jgi:hypothetical protein
LSRRLVGAVLALVVAVATAVALYTYLMGGQGEKILLVLEVEGQVVVTPVAGGAEAAESGRELVRGDRIATSADARAVLALGADTRIRLAPASTVEVQSVDEEGVSLELENGALQARVRPESGAVRVSNRRREVLSTGGEFTFAARDGMVEVRALTGDLMMQGVDEVRIESGARATISDKHAEIGPIPDQLLLDVAWPEGLAARVQDEAFTVTGQTEPGAEVTVSGGFGHTTVIADAMGAFIADVPLAEGENSIRISAVDLLGNVVDVTGNLPTRDTIGPKTFKIGVEYHKPRPQ